MNSKWTLTALTLGFCSHYSKKWVMGGKDADRQRRVAEYTGRERGVDLLHKKGLLKDADSTAQFDDSSLDSDRSAWKEFAELNSQVSRSTVSVLYDGMCNCVAVVCCPGNFSWELVCSQYAHMLWNVRILASQVEDMYIVFCALQLSHQCCNAKLPTSPKFANTRGLNVLHCVAHSSAWHVCRWFDMLECAKQNVGAWFMWLDCLPWFDVPQYDAAEKM